MGDPDPSVGQNAQAAPEWEVSKENYQPLKTGRKVVGLSDPAKPSTEEQRASFVREIAEYKGDDPLEVWLRYIKWTQEAFKAGGHKSDVLPLLERCTRELQSTTRYRDDIRYLRVWIQYADCLPDPTDVFAFLKENDICQGHALFWEAHAALLELRGGYAAADKTYQQGINRLAAPLDRLKRKYDDFQNRMARRIQRSVAEAAATGGGDDDADDPRRAERQTLAVLGGRPRPPPSQNPNKRKAVAPSARANAPAGGGLEIFVDEEFGGPSASAPAALAAPPPSTWTALPSYEAGRKENTQKASTWAGQRLKQKAAFAPPPAPALDIPMDPEFEQQQERAQRMALPAPGAESLRQRLDRSGLLEEQLAHDPLRLHRHPPPPQAHPQQEAKKEVLGCAVALLQGRGGEERCFEEVRFGVWEEKRKQREREEREKREEEAAAPMEEEVEEEEAGGAANEPMAVAEMVDAAPVANALPTPFAQMASQATGVDERADSQDVEANAAAAAALAACASDVTMATRGAFDAMNAIFGSRFGGDDVCSGEIAGAEPTMTMSREALAAAFQESGSLSDVTLNTKSAFEALNAAFGGSRNARQSNALGGNTFSIREDTVFIDPSAGREEGQDDDGEGDDSGGGGGLLIREDTVFFNPRAANAALEDAQSGDGGGPDIREDTVFIRRGGSLAAAPAPTPGGPSIREDTVFIRRDGAAPAPTPRGLSIREDTVFIRRDGTGAAACIDDDGATVPLGAEDVASKWGFAPGADDTLVFGAAAAHVVDAADDDAPTATLQLAAGMQAASLGASTGSDDHDQGWADENAEPAVAADDDATAPLPRRRPAAGTTPLRAMSHGEVVTLGSGSSLEPNPTAEAAMQDGGSGGDGFFAREDDPTAPPPLVIDPFSPTFQAQLLGMLTPPVAEWPGVAVPSEGEERAALSALCRLSPSFPAEFELAGRSYRATSLVGAGSYASVYAIGPSSALKVESPPCPWEWVVCRAVAGRLEAASPADRARIVMPGHLTLGATASAIEMPLGAHGSLHALVNVHRTRGLSVDETVAARVTAALCRAMASLHGTARVLHNDIKPDNVLVTLADTATLDVQLIDFGRAVDMEMLPPGSFMTGDSETSGFRCVEMREGRPWVWAGDAYGVAAVAHVLLHGEYMEVERVVDQGGEERAALRPRAPLRRYWNGIVWGAVFDALLNSPGMATAPPQWSEMAQMIEGWLEGSEDMRRKEREATARLMALLQE